MVSLYRQALERKSDIQQHLGLLYGLAEQCETVVEFGVREGVSTAALCAGCDRVISYDTVRSEPYVTRLKKEYPSWEFRKESSLSAQIPICDMMFIDSEHTYKHLISELTLHHGRVGRWIVMHDTEKFHHKDYYGNPPGLWKAVMDFLDGEGEEWEILLNLRNNHGLTILRRRWAG